MSRNVKNVAKKSLILAEISKASGEPAEKVRIDVDKAKKMGISANKYLENQCWLLNDEELRALGEKLKLRKETREANIRTIIEETGWSEEKTKASLKFASSYGFTSTQYVRYECWKLDEKELVLLSEKISKEKTSKSSRRCEKHVFYSIITTKDDRSYARIEGVEESVEKLEIPDSIQGFRVEVVKKGAFRENEILQEVTVPDTVRLIGAEAFFGCKNLKYVALPLDLEVINRSCFENCISLQEIILPYSLKRICDKAFRNCKSLRRAYHFVKKGIGFSMTVDRSLTEDKLPSGMETIGKHAFEGCESLTSVYLPYKITTLNENVFAGCINLAEIHLHNKVELIDNKAFAGCVNLRCVRLPECLVTIGNDAFDQDTQLVCNENVANEALKDNNYKNVQIVKHVAFEVDSKMVPYDGEHVPEAFYSETELAELVQQYEIRNPIDLFKEKEERRIIGKPSRYTLEGDTYVYRKTDADQCATILMTGDLMARSGQIKSAMNADGTYDFDESFAAVKSVLAEGDLVIGNMESMVCDSCTFASESMYIDDRVHLNAPEAYLTSVRDAGYDLVINAQNHSYDTGTRGLFETLDAFNRAQLMHTGLFASETEKRYILLSVNGIKIGVVSYFDQARQSMKRVNFTQLGLDVMFSTFAQEQIEEDIRAAKADGAEFILAYIHCGREYTPVVTDRQSNFARMVANAGADFIFGCHSHCLQPYSVIAAKDGRSVPVLYSGGNFVSDINLTEIAMDSMICQLKLRRNAEGNVQIESEGYYPCLIRPDRSIGGKISVKLISDMLDDASMQEQIKLEEILFRIYTAVGKQSRFKMLLEDEKNPMRKLNLNQDDQDYQMYEVGCMPISQQRRTETNSETNSYYFNETEKLYKREKDESLREARIICAGQIGYDRVLERDAECFGNYEFSKSFKTVANCMQDTDFAIGNLVSMASNSYPTMLQTKRGFKTWDNYFNAREEYIDALKGAGFGGLAMAHPQNVCTGVQGIFESEELLADKGIISSGIGKNKNPIVEINGIRIAFLSYTVNCVNQNNIITDEASHTLLNKYEPDWFKKTLEDVKAQGAEFVITYVNCGDINKKLNLAGRKAVAEEIAEIGSDYVICTVPKIVSRYYRYETSDGRIVPIATSLGSFMTGNGGSSDEVLSALIKIVVRKTFDGTIEYDDNFIPLKLFKEFKGVQHSVLPAQSYFNKDFEDTDFADVCETLTSKLGKMLKPNRERAVMMKTHYKDNFTIEDIYKLLDKKPSEEDLKAFGESYTKPVSCLASMRTDLKKGCVAIIGGFAAGYQISTKKLEIQHAVNEGAALVIANKKYNQLPCIVVDEPVERVYTRLASIIRDKFDPLTIAITGSVGKTTTKDLMSNVFATHFREFHIEGNNNTVYSIRQVLQKMEASDEVYIQEVHGGTISAAKNVSNLIKPNICVITSIGHAHLGQMGSIENVIAGKMEIIEGMQDGGVLIINDDNEYLKEQHPDVKTIRYSSYNTECDYYAQNIVRDENGLSFQIVSKGGEFDEPGVYDARLNIQGEHNVNNAVGVFATARQANIPPHKIVAGIAHYQTEGVRQNMVNVGGSSLLLDVYSTNPISMLSAMKELENMPLGKGGKRIAVIGELPDQGDQSKQLHYETGLKAAEYDFDVMLCIGPDSEFIAEGVKERGKEAYCFRDRNVFNSVLAELVKPGDAVLFKASTRFAPMNDATIIPVFGRL